MGSIRLTSTVVALLLLGTGAPARADETLAPDPAQELGEARGMRIAGQTISLLSVACEVTTMVLWVSAVVQADDDLRRNGEYGPPLSPALFLAAISTSAAVPLLMAIGIPLWSVGANHEKRAKSPPVTVSASGVLRF